MAAVTHSLWDEETLSASRFKDVRKHAAVASAAHPEVTYWQDAYSVGVSGQLLPKRPIIMLILSSLWYELCGELGFWLVIQLFLVGIAYDVFYLGQHLVGPWLGLGVAFLMPMLTIIYSCFYSFSHDLLGACLVIWGIVLLRIRLTLGACYSVARCAFR